jgi:hypothetical protein
MYITAVNAITGIISFYFARPVPRAPVAIPADLSTEAVMGTPVEYQTFAANGRAGANNSASASGCENFRDSTANVWSVLKTVARDEEYYNFRLLWVARVAYFFAVAPLFSLLLYYFEDITSAKANGTDAVSKAGVIVLGSGIVASPFAAPIVDYFGRKMLVYLSVAFMSVLLFTLPQLYDVNTIYYVIPIMGVRFYFI